MEKTNWKDLSCYFRKFIAQQFPQVANAYAWAKISPETEKWIKTCYAQHPVRKAKKA